MNTQHTPTPWELDSPLGSETFFIGPVGVDGAIAVVCMQAEPMEAQANAAFIVRACNAHDELVAALSDLEDIFDGQEDCDDGVPNDAMRAMTIIRAALAKAGAL